MFCTWLTRDFNDYAASFWYFLWDSELLNQPAAPQASINNNSCQFNIHATVWQSSRTIWPSLLRFCGSIINWISNNAPKGQNCLFSPFPFLSVLAVSVKKKKKTSKASPFFVAQLVVQIGCKILPSAVPALRAQWNPPLSRRKRHTGCYCVHLWLWKCFIKRLNPPVLQQQVPGDSSLAGPFWWVSAWKRRLVYL